MPKVLSYTPAWLTRPSVGHRLFASSKKPPPLATDDEDKVPANGEYHGPQRTIACRNTEVFVVVDNQIRWSDLSMLKYDWESSQEPKRGQNGEDRGTEQIYKVCLLGSVGLKMLTQTSRL